MPTSTNKNGEWRSGRPSFKAFYPEVFILTVITLVIIGFACHLSCKVVKNTKGAKMESVSVDATFVSNFAFAREDSIDEIVIDEEPVAEEPAAEPVVEEPVAEEPAAEPVVEEPVAEEPAAEPVVEEPVAEEPAAEPVVEEPVVEEPVAEAPAAEPVVEEPVAEEPAAEPVASEPVASEPVADAPATTPTAASTSEATAPKKSVKGKLLGIWIPSIVIILALWGWRGWKWIFAVFGTEYELRVDEDNPRAATFLIKRGIFNKTTDSMHIGSIKDVQSSQSIWQKYLKGGVGTIRLMTKDLTDGVVVMDNMAEPSRVFNAFDTLRKHYWARGGMTLNNGSGDDFADADGGFHQSDLEG